MFNASTDPAFFSKTVILKLFEIYVCVCCFTEREKRSDDDAIVLGIVLGSYL